MLTRLVFRIAVLFMAIFIFASEGGANEPINSRNVNAGPSEYKIPYRSDEYIEPTFTNFEFILWRYGGYDLEDEQHILRFIALNDCKLFKRYMNYDLEWARIKQRYKDFLKENHEMFPGRIRVRIPIGLKRFDEEASSFTLSEDTQFDNVRLLPVKRFDSGQQPTCELHSNYLESYSQYLLNDVAVSLKYPLTLKELPVPKAEARKYIEYVQRHNNYNKDVEGRVAYTFYDIDIFDYIRKTESGGHLFYGEVVNVEIYANEDKSFLLYKVNPRDQIDTTANRNSIIGIKDDGDETEGSKDKK